MSTDKDILLERKRDDVEIRVRLSNTATECHLTLIPRNQIVLLSPEDLTNVLKELGVVEGLLLNALQSCCHKITHHHPVQDVLVAKGVPAHAGKDARLEFLSHTISHGPSFTENHIGHVDFHDTHLLDNVHVGQEIALVHPPLPGADGRSVTGKIIPAPLPKDNVVKAGDGAEYREKDFTFVALKDGRVIFKGNVIKVSDELVVEGNVDFAVGHILFDGFVHVKGDVLDGFNIKAKKEIHVYKNAGRCKLECDGDIALAGMDGRGIAADTNPLHAVSSHTTCPGTITCKGNLTARYLHHVCVECEGDVHVTKEILHSTIKAAGTVTVSGRIVGGECTAFRGMEVMRAGTEMGIPTELSAGEDYRVLRQESSISAALEHLHKERQTLVNEVGPGPYTVQHISALPPHVRERTVEVLSQLHQLDQQVSQLKETIASAKNQSTGNPKINVLREAFAGTVIQLGSFIQKLNELVKGPASLIEHHDELHIGKYTPLSKPARDTQEELLNAEKLALWTKARKLGIEPEGKEKNDLIHAMQIAEGFTPCYATSDGTCTELHCFFRKDCLATKAPAA